MCTNILGMAKKTPHSNTVPREGGTGKPVFIVVERRKAGVDDGEFRHLRHVPFGTS